MSEFDITSVSCGAGIQSTAIALLIRDGILPRPDVAIFADTGWEPAAVYEQVDRLEALFVGLGVEFHRVSNGNLRRDPITPGARYASIPYFVLAPEGIKRDPIYGEPDENGDEQVIAYGPSRPLTRTEREGMGRRQCTSEYKLSPINRKIRELLGAKAPDFRRVPKGKKAEQWIGFSTDEVIRANRRKDSQGVQYLDSRYPLLDLGMSRKDCERYLAEQGWGHTVKSACIGCPFHGNAQWRDLRDNHPDEWADAIAFDAAIRKGGSRGLPLDGKAYLHRSRVPLDLAPIDRRTRAENTAAQTDIFDLLENGPADGCSPYGCRSDGAS